MANLKVLSVKMIPKKYRILDGDSGYCAVNYKISFMNLNTNKIVTIYLPKRYFKSLYSDGKIVANGYSVEKGEKYNCSYSTFKDIYNKDVYCYSIECGDKYFNLYYDELFNELL